MHILKNKTKKFLKLPHETGKPFFQDMTPCYWIIDSQHFHPRIRSQYVCSKRQDLRSPNDVASYLRKTEWSATPLRKSEHSHQGASCSEKQIETQTDCKVKILYFHNVEFTSCDWSAPEKLSRCRTAYESETRAGLPSLIFCNEAPTRHIPECLQTVSVFLLLQELQKWKL